MTTNYEPGALAVATVRGVPNVRVTRNEEYWISDRVVAGWRAHGDEDVTDIRPLIVLDLGDGEDYAAAVKALRELAAFGWQRVEGYSFGYDIADQIEAQTRPAITEPTGLGAVVDTAEGRTFVRTAGDPRFPWVDATNPRDNSYNWTLNGGLDRCTPLRVLSEGWSE